MRFVAVALDCEHGVNNPLKVTQSAELTIMIPVDSPCYRISGGLHSESRSDGTKITSF